MAWKIFNIETGELVKGGFEDEDAAKAWLENRFGESIDLDAFDINEMDDDEEYDSGDDEYTERATSYEEAEETDDDDAEEDDMVESLPDDDDDVDY